METIQKAAGSKAIMALNDVRTSVAAHIYCGGEALSDGSFRTVLIAQALEFINGYDPGVLNQ